jgi:exodeoxyribonuclease VII small subunit
MKALILARIKRTFVEKTNDRNTPGIYFMTQKTFEESLVQLEEILTQLGNGTVDLETALQQYEEGVGILKRCHKILDSAQRKIEILRGENSNGSPQIEPAAEEEFKTCLHEGDVKNLP